MGYGRGVCDLVCLAKCAHAGYPGGSDFQANNATAAVGGADASQRQSQYGFDNLQQALDGNPHTRWSTVHPQRPGMWFQADLGQVRTVSQIQLTNASSPMDYPRGYILKVSTDSQNWERVDQKTQDGQPVNVVFSPRPIRFFRVEQTGYSDRWWWSIHNIQIS